VQDCDALAPLAHQPTWLAVAAERAVSRAMGGSCSMPLAACNAVSHFFALKPAFAHVFRAQAAIKTRAFVTGPGSLAALHQAGVDAAWMDAPDTQAGQFDSEALWAVVAHRVVPGYRVLIVRGGPRGGHPPPHCGGGAAGRLWRGV
jgi:hypothetical protein